MGTFAQWRKNADKGELRRVTYVCGDQRALVREVVERTVHLIKPGRLDYHSTSGAEPGVWAKAFQHALVPGENRLLVIYDAEKIRSWAPFATWMAGTRTLPGVYLLFVSNDADLPREGRGKRAKADAHIEAMKPPRGYVVRCTALNEADAVAWVRSRSPLDEATAQHLLTRVGGNLTTAAAVCAKLAVFGAVAVNANIINQLVGHQPGDDFIDSLLAGNKPDAFQLVPEILERDHGKLVALLDSRLDLLTLLWEAQAQGRYGQAVTGVNPYLVRQYTAIAKFYDPKRCAYSRQVLAVVDSAFREGAREGVWETLVALW